MCYQRIPEWVTRAFRKYQLHVRHYVTSCAWTYLWNQAVVFLCHVAIECSVINTVLYIRKRSCSFKSQRWKALEVIFHGYPTLPQKKTHGVFCVHVSKGNDAWKRLCGLHLFVCGCEPNRQGQVKKHTETNKQKTTVLRRFFFYQSSQPVGFKVKPFCLKGLRFQKKVLRWVFGKECTLWWFFCYWMVRCLGATLWKRVHLDD